MPKKRKSMKRFRAMLIRNATKQEAKLYGALSVALAPYRAGFEFQRIIGPFVADFYIHAARLVIEVDGSSHYTDVGIKRDQNRTGFMEVNGFRIMRFKNREIDKNVLSVVQKIMAKCGRLPLLNDPVPITKCPPGSAIKP